MQVFYLKNAKEKHFSPHLRHIKYIVAFYDRFILSFFFSSGE